MAEEKSGGNSNMPLIIGGGVIFLMIWDKIFGQSKEEKQAEQEEDKLNAIPPSKNPLTEQYKPVKPPAGQIAFRSTKTIPGVPGNYFSSAAVGIKNAIGKFTDDEAAIISYMKRAATKTELALISKTYAATFKRDLWFDLKDNLNAEELLPILKTINKLPDSIPGKQVKK